jgi:hypothetical protein
VFEPLILIPALLVLSFLVWRVHLSNVLVWVAVALVLAHIGSYVRRELALAHVLAQMKQSDFEQRHNLIAHSLGSYLAGRIIRRHAWFKLSHIVFAGCVLPRKFDWRKLGLVNHPKVKCESKTPAEKQKDSRSLAELEANAQAMRVRNDVQRRDVVPILANCLRAFLVPDFGMAGCSGFKDTALCPPQITVIHGVPRPAVECKECSSNTHLAPLHNVVCDEYWHSDVLRDERYVSSFWLPFLFDIDPPEYCLFVDIFVKAEEAKGKSWTTVKEKERQFRNHEWRWAGCNLTEFVQNEIEAYLQLEPRANVLPIQDLVDLAIGGTWKAFNLALNAYVDRTAGWQTRVLALNPRIAVSKAVYELLKLS